MTNKNNIGHLISAVSRLTNAETKAGFAQAQINVAEGMALMFLRMMGGTATQATLNKGLQFDRGVLTRTMKSLEAMNLVERKPDPHDGRSFLFSITETAHPVVDVVMNTVMSSTHKLTAGISAEDLEVTTRVLQRMQANMKDEHEEMLGAGGHPRGLSTERPVGMPQGHPYPNPNDLLG